MKRNISKVKCHLSLLGLSHLDSCRRLFFSPCYFSTLQLHLCLSGSQKGGLSRRYVSSLPVSRSPVQCGWTHRLCSTHTGLGVRLLVGASYLPNPRHGTNTRNGSSGRQEKIGMWPRWHCPFFMSLFANSKNSSSMFRFRPLSVVTIVTSKLFSTL